jgi:hypothetical protein
MAGNGGAGARKARGVIRAFLGLASVILEMFI